MPPPTPDLTLTLSLTKLCNPEDGAEAQQAWRNEQENVASASSQRSFEVQTGSNPRTEQIVFLSHQMQGIRDRLLLKITPPVPPLHPPGEKKHQRTLCDGLKK